MAANDSDEAGRLARLHALVSRAERSGPSQLSDAEILDLVRLYRFGASRIALHDTTGRDPARLAEIQALIARTHSLLYRDLDRAREGLLARVGSFFWSEVPRAIRAEWRILLASFALLYGLAAISFSAVRNDLELAYALLDPEVVANEIRQLEETERGQPFRGNFTFGVGRSPTTSGWIMAHNMSVGILCFASGLAPPLFLWIVATNGLMLGTYTAVAAHWGQAGEISSILWCHGVLEIQAIVLAAAAGLVLVRAWIAPGPWTRHHAMKLESARAWRLLAPVFPMLFVAGLIEGFVSPHVSMEGRVATAVASAGAIGAWVSFGGKWPTWLFLLRRNR